MKEQLQAHSKNSISNASMCTDPFYGNAKHRIAPHGVGKYFFMTDKLIPFNSMWWLIPENSYGAKWCKKFQTAAVFSVLNVARNHERREDSRR